MKVLSAVSDRLKSRGFASPQPSADPNFQEQQLWFKADDPKKTIIGGWRWLGGKGQPLLSIGFGIKPEEKKRDFSGNNLKPADAILLAFDLQKNTTLVELKYAATPTRM